MLTSRETDSRWTWRSSYHNRGRRSGLCVRYLDVGPPLQPRRHGKALRAQELRIEQLRLIARAEVGENGDDGVARPHVFGEPDGAGDVDPGRAAHAQSFVLEHLEDQR